MSLKLITPVATEPVSLAEAKLQLRVSGNAEDTLISSLISMSRELLEAKTMQAAAAQTWRRTLDCFPSAIELPMTPVTSVASIKYRDTNNNLQTLNPANYRLDNSSDFKSAWVVPADGYDWPSTFDSINAVEVEFVAGYATIPATYKQWMLVMIGHFYRNRESATELNLQPLAHLDSLLTRKRSFYV